MIFMTKFDLENEIEQLEISNMLKNGFKYHIKEFNIKITTKKELNDKAEYIILEDRMHNPDYKKESVDYLNEFYNKLQFNLTNI